jgi:hypothetical protein
MITNNIITGNHSGIYNESSSPTISYNNFWKNLDAVYEDSLPDLSGNISVDPMFVDPSNGDYHLQTGSPCIDVGTNDAPGRPETDFDGNPRIIDGDDKEGAVVDMGAFEYQVSESNQIPVADAGENIDISTEQMTITIIQGTATDGDENDTLEYRWVKGETALLDWTSVDENGECPLDLSTISIETGTHTLTLEVTDGQDTSSDGMILTIDNSAPQAVPTGGGTYQIGDPINLGGQVSDFDGDWLSYEWLVGDEVQFDGQVEVLYGGDPVVLPEHELWGLDIGSHILTLRVADEYNAPVSSDISVEVVDTMVPTLAPTFDKSILWPANHKMVDITIVANADDISGGPVSLSVMVSSNEPEDGTGDGRTASDWKVVDIDDDSGIITLRLRAESSGSGDGRIYTITITATDEAGNSSTSGVEIIVPHDKRKKRSSSLTKRR